MENRAVAYIKLRCCLHCSERAKGERKEGQKGAPAETYIKYSTARTWHLGVAE